MRRLLLTLLLMLMVCPAFADQNAPEADSPKWQRAVQDVSSLREASKKDALLTRKAIREERETFRAERAKMRVERNERKAEYKALLARFENLVKQEADMRRALESRQGEMKLLKGTVLGAARKMKERSLNSPVTAEHPDRLPQLDALLNDGRFPGLDSIQTLADMVFGEMHASAKVVRRDGEWVAEDGTAHTGTVVRFGSLGAGFVGDGEAGYLRPSADGALEAVVGDLDGAVGALEEFANGQRPDVPLDFSGGDVFRRFKKESAFAGLLAHGGFLVWPILFAGLIGMGLACERFWTLWRIRVCPECRMNKAFVWAGRGDLDKCASCLGTKGSTPTCRVLSHVILHSGGSLVSMEKGLQEAILQELPKLERFLPTMNILAAVAPLLGLLGTVTGMIDTFRVITVFGAGDPRMMSGGISEALITTQLGLAVAVPLTLVHHFLERKVDRIVADMEEKGTTLVARLVSAEGK